MKIEGKNNDTKICRSKRRNYRQKCFHSFKYIIYHANFLLYVLRSSFHSLNDVHSLQYSVYTLQQFV